MQEQRPRRYTTTSTLPKLLRRLRTFRNDGLVEPVPGVAPGVGVRSSTFSRSAFFTHAGSPSFSFSPAAAAFFAALRVRFSRSISAS